MAICPNCKNEVSGLNVERMNIDDGQKASIDNLIKMKVHTTMFCCPNCKTVLGFGQYISY